MRFKFVRETPDHWQTRHIMLYIPKILYTHLDRIALFDANRRVALLCMYTLFSRWFTDLHSQVSGKLDNYEYTYTTPKQVALYTSLCDAAPHAQ